MMKMILFKLSELIDFENDPDFPDPDMSIAGFYQTIMNAVDTLVYRNNGFVCYV